METQVLNESKSQVQKEVKPKNTFQGIRPTAAFIGASWAALGIGLISYCIGLWNAAMELNEKGYYFAIILFGLFFSYISTKMCEG